MSTPYTEKPLKILQQSLDPLNGGVVGDITHIQVLAENCASYYAGAVAPAPKINNPPQNISCIDKIREEPGVPPIPPSPNNEIIQRTKSTGKAFRQQATTSHRSRSLSQSIYPLLEGINTVSQTQAKHLIHEQAIRITFLV